MRNNFRAPVDWERGPRHKGLVRGGQGFQHLLIGMLCEGLKNFSSSWITLLYGTVGSFAVRVTADH
jgi:hypothetical protein